MKLNNSFWKLLSKLRKKFERKLHLRESRKEVSSGVSWMLVKDSDSQCSKAKMLLRVKFQGQLLALLDHPWWLVQQKTVNWVLLKQIRTILTKLIWTILIGKIEKEFSDCYFQRWMLVFQPMLQEFNSEICKVKEEIVLLVVFSIKLTWCQQSIMKVIDVD